MALDFALGPLMLNLWYWFCIVHVVRDDEPEADRPWKGLVPLDLPPANVVPGSGSEECKTQAARESATLQALYFKGQVYVDGITFLTSTPLPRPPPPQTNRSSSVRFYSVDSHSV